MRASDGTAINTALLPKAERKRSRVNIPSTVVGGVEADMVEVHGAIPMRLCTTDETLAWELAVSFAECTLGRSHRRHYRSRRVGLAAH